MNAPTQPSAPQLNHTTPWMDPVSEEPPRTVGGCLAACPVKTDGSPCLQTCTLTNGHYGPHRCSTGHTWS